jgi:hypothetical protein
MPLRAFVPSPSRALGFDIAAPPPPRRWAHPAPLHPFAIGAGSHSLRQPSPSWLLVSSARKRAPRTVRSPGAVAGAVPIDPFVNGALSHIFSHRHTISPTFTATAPIAPDRCRPTCTCPVTGVVRVVPSRGYVLPGNRRRLTSGSRSRQTSGNAGRTFYVTGRLRVFKSPT